MIVSVAVAALCLEGLAALPMPAAAQHKAPRRSAMTHLRRGYDYEQEGDLGAAEQEYTLAIEADRSSPEGYLSRGDVFRKQRKYVRAVDDCTTAIGLDPRMAEAYMVRASAYEGLV